MIAGGGKIQHFSTEDAAKEELMSVCVCYIERKRKEAERRMNYNIRPELYSLIACCDVSSDKNVKNVVRASEHTDNIRSRPAVSRPPLPF